LFVRLSYLLLLFCCTSIANENNIKQHYQFASIEYLFEQEVGRVVLPQIYLQLGIDIDITPLPGNRAQYVVNSGSFDGEIMRIWSYGDENSTSLRVPTPYYYLETMAFVRTDSGIKITQAEDLKQFRVGRVRGVKHTNNITVGLSDIYDLNSTQLMFELLMQKKIDVALTNTLDGQVIIKRNKFDHIEPMKKPLAKLALYHYIHKKNKVLIPLVDQQIRDLSETDELKSLINQAENYVITQHMSASHN